MKLENSGKSANWRNANLTIKHIHPGLSIWLPCFFQYFYFIKQGATHSSRRSWFSSSLALRSVSRSLRESSYISWSSVISLFLAEASASTPRLVSDVEPEVKKFWPRNGSKRDLMTLAPPYIPPSINRNNLTVYHRTLKLGYIVTVVFTIKIKAFFWRILHCSWFYF